MQQPTEGLGYPFPGATRPADPSWEPDAPGFRSHDETVPIGRGEADWADAAQVLTWAVKTRSGFAVDPPGPVSAGTDLELVASVGPFRVREPVRVVEVVDLPGGFWRPLFPVLLVAQRVYRRRYRRALVRRTRSTRVSRR